MANHPNRSMAAHKIAQAPKTIFHRPAWAHAGMMETGVGYVTIAGADGKIAERHYYGNVELAAAAWTSADPVLRRFYGGMDDVAAARELGIYNGRAW